MITGVTDSSFQPSFADDNQLHLPMKKPILICCLLTISYLTSLSQDFPYTLTTFTDTYQPLSKALSLTPSDDPTWDDPEQGFYNVPIGFSFSLMGRSAEELLLIDPGCQIVIADNMDTLNVFTPYFADIRNADDDTVVSSILYATEGLPGTRIFKMEWNNVGFFNEFDATGQFHLKSNYQVWLYEGTHDIEFRFGPNTIEDGTLIHEGFGSPLLLFVRDFLSASQTFELSWNLRGAPENPTVGPIDLNVLPELDQILLGEPMNGIVYHFDTGLVAVAESDQNPPFKIFPTVANDRVTISVNQKEKMNVSITNILGEVVYNGTIKSGNQFIDVANWQAGVYLVNVTNGKEVLTQRIIKQ